jgi:hypothetical protein
MEAMERIQPVIRVVDVPDAATAEEAERLMNGPCDQANYLLVNVLYMEPLRSTRAFFRLSAREQAGRTDTARSVGVGGNKANRDGNDEAARAVIKANATMTITALIAKLKEMGIDRRKTWVTYQRLNMRGTTARLIEG